MCEVHSICTVFMHIACVFFYQWFGPQSMLIPVIGMHAREMLCAWKKKVEWSVINVHLRIFEFEKDSESSQHFFPDH